MQVLVFVSVQVRRTLMLFWQKLPELVFLSFLIYISIYLIYLHSSI